MDLAGLKIPAAAAPAVKPPMSPEEAAKRAKISETAQSFEASFLSTMMQSMFAGVDAGAFGGGEGENAFKSLLMDSFVKQTAKAGGLGISDQIGREMLKLQGLG
jgi:Rod binding domain-containing protein